MLTESRITLEFIVPVQLIAWLEMLVKFDCTMVAFTFEQTVSYQLQVGIQTFKPVPAFMMFSLFKYKFNNTDCATEIEMPVAQFKIFVFSILKLEVG